MPGALRAALTVQAGLEAQIAAPDTLDVGAGIDHAGPLLVGAAVATSVTVGNALVCGAVLMQASGTGHIAAAVGGAQVMLLEGNSADFVAFGSAPAQSGAVRLSNGNNNVGIVSRDAAGLTDVGLMSLDAGNNLFFNTLGTLNSIQLGQTPAFFWNLLNGTTFGQANRPTDTQASALQVRAQSAWSGAAVFVDGGAAIVMSGDAQANGVNGHRGAVRLNLSHTATQVGAEIAELAVGGQRVVALGFFGAGVTTAQAPVGSGDAVVLIANAQAVPTVAPVGTVSGVAVASVAALIF